MRARKKNKKNLENVLDRTIGGRYHPSKPYLSGGRNRLHPHTVGSMKSFHSQVINKAKKAADTIKTGKTVKVDGKEIHGPSLILAKAADEAQLSMKEMKQFLEKSKMLTPADLEKARKKYMEKRKKDPKLV